MVELDYGVYSAMQEGKPLASYIKTTLGKIRVMVINPFNDIPEEVIVYGDPSKKEDLENIVIDIWDEKGDAYFKRANAFHLKKGNIIPYERTDDVPEGKNYNALTDEEIQTYLDSRFLALKWALDKVTEENAIIRFLKIAELSDKSNAIITKIKERMSEIQRGE